MGQGHNHAHDHGHGGHSHAIAADADQRKLTLALSLLLGLMVLEVVAGFLAGSLALLSDAAHMLTDAAAIGLAIGAARLARRPAKGVLTFGWRRVEILSAQLNGITLLVLGLLILGEGISRLLAPPDVEGGVVLAVALVGVVVNLAATATLAQANRTSLNVEGAFQHVLTDLYAFIATAIAGAVVLLTGFARADGLAALLIAALMLHAAAGLLKASTRVFLEAAPEGVDPDAIGLALAAQPHVVEVHDLHVWEVSSGFPVLTAHVLVESGGDCHGTRELLEHRLADEFGIEHSTLQMEHAPATALLEIAPAQPA